MADRGVWVDLVRNDLVRVQEVQALVKLHQVVQVQGLVAAVARRVFAGNNFAFNPRPFWVVGSTSYLHWARWLGAR